MMVLFRLVMVAFWLGVGVISVVGCGDSSGVPLPGQTDGGFNTPTNQETKGGQPSVRPVSSSWPSVGRKCRDDQDCVAELFCERQVPEGYCTKACQRSADCPGTSLCVRITFSQGTQLQRCVGTCTSAEDCRPDFVCYRPSKATSQICLPVLP